MALRVGLPLNGNINNYGISDVTVTNNGATVDNNGKIGKCYKCSGDSRLSFPSYTGMSMKPQNNFSVFFGAKGTTTGWLFACSAGEFRLCPTYIQIHLAGDGRYPARYNDTFNNNSGYHLGFTGSGTLGKLILYLNGIEVASSDVPSSANYSIASTFNLPYDGPRYLNDFRVYDHCLSAKEAKELAKGLILHYKLTGPGGMNIISNFDTSFNTTAVGATTLFENQMNNGTQEILSSFAGKNKVLHLHSNGGSNRMYRYYAVTSGKSYTVSLDYYSTSTHATALHCELNGGNYNWLGSNCAYSTPGVGKRLSATYTNITSNATLYIFMMCNANSDCYIKNIKLEEGTVATPGCPNSADALYGALGYNNNIEDDCSGYCRNGTKNGTITGNSDSPRYSSSYNFSSYTGGIKSNNTITVKDEYTMAIWVKFNTIPSNENTLLGMYNGISEGRTLINKQSGNNFICVGVGGGSNSSNVQVNSSTQLVANTWYHVAATKDKTNTLRLYFNGQEQGTPVTTNYSGGTNYPTVGSINYSSSGYNGNYNLSDARIYATALSAADILELYNTPLSIDNVGNMYTYEFKEI